MKKLILGGVAAACLVFAGTGTASAGEYTGNGGTTPVRDHAGSVCAFSGLDMKDATAGGTEVNPPGFDDDALGYDLHGVQNYGQFVSQGQKDLLGDERPGVSCRGFASMR